MKLKKMFEITELMLLSKGHFLNDGDRIFIDLTKVSIVSKNEDGIHVFLVGDSNPYTLNPVLIDVDNIVSRMEKLSETK